MDQWILKNKKYFVAFLAGFTDAEGCISISKLNQAFYSLGNYNFKLLGQIRNKLMEFGINCSRLIESKIKGRRIGKTKYVHNQNYWQLTIHRKNALLKFFNLINHYLEHLDKVRAMQNAERNIMLRNEKYGYINMD